MKQTLTAEQLEALQQFAKQYGRTWKSALREAWMTGNYGTFENSNLLQQIRNTFGPSWLVSFRLPNETPSKVTLSPKSAQAAQKYGLDTCIKAYARNQEGYGASTIAFENGWKTNQANAAINAGEEYTVFTTGHGLPYGAPAKPVASCCIADGAINVIKFVLEIELGNDAMKTGSDVLNALRDSLKDEETLPLEVGVGGRLWEVNGNTVGKWEVIDETACKVCGVSAAKHGHYDAHNAKTHQWKAK